MVSGGGVYGFTLFDTKRADASAVDDVGGSKRGCRCDGATAKEGLHHGADVVVASTGSVFLRFVRQRYRCAGRLV